MEIKARTEGLCQNCKFVNECSYINNSSKPTLFCEEFEVELTIENQSNMESFGTNWEIPNQSEVKGLCTNCENVNECNYKTESKCPIMFCEQYC